AEANIGFSKFSGESDSSQGGNDWSIQLNTNFFPGSNGDTDWVQFVEQNYPTYLYFFGYATFCIWQVDVTTQSYPNTCVGTSIQTLSSSAAPWISYSAGPQDSSSSLCRSRPAFSGRRRLLLWSPWPSCRATF
ncbi:MAG: hypothetical protein JRN29_01100, partial [Nitrososphaerota archaeon]|nr:hypothetical protein [Nitrososphaerota archaeon]